MVTTNGDYPPKSPLSKGDFPGYQGWGGSSVRAYTNYLYIIVSIANLFKFDLKTIKRAITEKLERETKIETKLQNTI